MARLRNITTLTLSLILCVDFARAEDTPPPESAKPAAREGSFNVTTGYFYRKRTDENEKVPAWPSQKMKSNTFNTVLTHSSGYLDGWLNADIGFIGAWNFEKDYRCSEVAFCQKKNDMVNGEPNIWANTDVDGIALYRALLEAKRKTGSFEWSLSAGYGQFNTGVFNVNWGFLFPGTYRGAQLIGKSGGLTMTYAWSDQYRTPWATEFGSYFGAGGERIDYLHSGSLRYQLESGFFAEAAVGQSYDWQDRYFGKIGYQDQKLIANYQYYNYKITGLDFAGRENTYGRQDVVSLSYLTPYFFTVTGEYVWTRASSWFNVPEFVPRMTAGYGNSQGRLDYWWNAVSDFNKHDERALNIGIRQEVFKMGNDSYGFFTGANLIYADNIAGWNSARAKTDNDGYERGYNLDFGFSVLKGAFQNASFNVHYTHLKAGGKDINPAVATETLFNRYGLFTTDDLKVMLLYTYGIKG